HRHTNYKALSYTWGPPEPTRDIKIDRQTFTIRENLYHFLQVAKWKYHHEWFWIDQICIDQSNMKERNHQVGMMGTIYQSAKLVVAWLGQSDKSSSRVMQQLKYQYTMTARGLVMSHTHYSIPHPFGSDLTHQELSAFSQRPYWSRLWIIQELVLA
ncbi:heterokaryon incompatibility, partial [Tothia fuscella]